ncbi:phenylalanine-tRNA ligase (macronuclear) [Tetrahymena thermophila SB210]|uniref:phenylalanine--tRNA ligase n=1 Tax=Tetrahymena thermophila (strain SB210) TaxID=312017 RepID=I7LY30_TETTS|nr:phenylalanine-tRNA ligase [Tetrahymena thermophila SB210]EAS07559.1 phenylalanine-tRNA ligase [Tetrahymena thermophila SB210]|eukprot:XP_001027801.1 phenylalanine-tRNA ligase [Tetrahymena thermophila SB210]
MILARQLNNFIKLNKRNLIATTLCFSYQKHFSSVTEQIRKEIEEKKSPYGNITPKIIELAGQELYKQPNHPLGIMRYKMEEFFTNDKYKKGFLHEKKKFPFVIGDSFSPVISVQQNFEDLLIPKDHVSRKRSDTYYISENYIMRPQATANERNMFEQKAEAFVIFADCFRRDEIDATHYPVFHQMEVVRAYTQDYFDTKNEDIKIQMVMKDLQETYESLVRNIFGEDVQYRWIPAYFPFTEPSLEMEIYFNGEWVEMFGCGILRKEIMKNFGRHDDDIAWASGGGLERFAMLLFGIPDIRLFWSKDSRFLNQFKAGQINKFQPFSKYPACYKDISFWIKDMTTFEENDIYEIVREIGGDLIEQVECVDTYENKKTGKTSKCFRINYRSLERTLTNQEIDTLQFSIRDEIKNKLGYELR